MVRPVFEEVYAVSEYRVLNNRVYFNKDKMKPKTVKHQIQTYMVNREDLQHTYQ